MNSFSKINSLNAFNRFSKEFQSKRLIIASFAAALLLSAVSLTRAQSLLDANYYPNPNNTVHALAVQSNKRILVSGAFSEIV